MELQKKIIAAFFAERHRLMLWAPVLLGIGAGSYYALSFEPSFIWSLAALCAALAGRVVGRRHYVPRLIAGALLCMALGFTAASFRTHMVAAPILHKTLYFREVTGDIDDIQIREEGAKLILSNITIEGVSPRTGPIRLSVSFKKSADGFSVGDRVKLKAMLFPPPTPVMPGAYDFARDFYFSQLGAVGFTRELPEIISKGTQSNFTLWLNALRLRIAARITASSTSENGPVAAAMMVGEQTAVSQDVSDAMRESGIYHVLSISGLHMSLAAGLIFFSVRFLLCLYPPWALRLPVKKISAVIGLFTAFAYLLLAGSPVPAIRSFVMVACMLLAILFDRRGLSLFSLAWAASIIILTQPEAMLGASFQLSFAATLGIISLYETYGSKLHSTGGGVTRLVGMYFAGLMITSLVATLCTTPLVLYHFNRMTIWGIAANMLMVPLASFWIMPAAILAFLLMPFGLDHWPLVWLDSGIGWMIWGAKWFASLPHAAIPIPSPTFWGILLTIAGGLWLCLWQHRWRLWGVPFIVLGVLTAFLYQPYDMLVSDDGSKVALLLDSGDYVFLRGKSEGFDAQAWLRSSGEEDALMRREATGIAGMPVCDKTACVGIFKGQHLAVALGRDTDNLCKPDTDIAVSSEWLDRNVACSQVHLLIDKKFLDKNGSVAFRFGSRTVMKTANAYRGDRPWVNKPYSRLYQSDNPAIKKP